MITQERNFGTPAIIIKSTSVFLKMLTLMVCGFSVIAAVVLLLGALALNFGRPAVRGLGALLTVALLFSPIFIAVLDRSVLRFLFRPLRTMAEPLLALHQIWPYRGLQEVTLGRRLVGWRDPSIDSSFYALATLSKLGYTEIDTYCHTNLPKFIARNFVAVEGGIQSQSEPEPSAFRQYGKALPSIYASSMAINVWKLILGIDLYHRPLTRSLAEKFENEQIGIDKLIAFTKGCLVPKSGGFFDHPGDPYRDGVTIQVVHSACFLLWNLGCLVLQPDLW